MEGTSGQMSREPQGCNPFMRLWRQFVPEKLTLEREREIEARELLKQVSLPEPEGLEAANNTLHDDTEKIRQQLKEKLTPNNTLTRAEDLIKELNKKLEYEI